MSQQNLDARISESVQKGLDKALSPLLQGLMGGILMPVIPSALAMLDGWTWRTESIIERRILTRGGGSIPLIAPIQGEKGWLNMLITVFSDPMSELLFRCDNWTFTTSPFLMNMIGVINPNDNLTYAMVYNPATPLGPMYGLHWAPSQFWPYHTQVLIEARHPATAPTAASQLVFFSLGRHYIRDEKEFYESIIREGSRQTMGRVEVPRGRR
jgi:hypothetical protein